MGESYRLGCDIGGTFTDFILLDVCTGEIRVEKCLTTPKDPAEGVVSGVRAYETTSPGCTSSIETAFHATTLVTNAIIERKGARTGLITTRGFRDILEIRREDRYDPFDVHAEYVEPLVPRYLRFEVAERILSTGAVLEPLDLESVRSAISRLGEAGVESVAVVLLHSYSNPGHEQIVGEELTARAPGIFVSLSAEVLPEIKEYERTSTTVLNAYAKPLVHRYLERLEQALRELGYRGRLLLMLSSGGITSSETARRFPVRIIESGPAAGAIASEYFGRLAGVPDLLSLDMGGTTAKACVIKDGQASKVFEGEVARLHRFQRGSGIPLKLPVLDLIEIGAGGGSIAKVSNMGTLQVGPESAAASPGPVCYGGCGTQPTVSDADLVLGYLDAGYFLGGEMRLDPVAATRAIQERVAQPLGVDLTEAAWGIHNIVNENMAMAAKVHMLERGQDPARFTIIAFGGAGPVHAYGVARKLKARRVLVPPAAGVMSALGLLVAPLSFDFVRTHKVTLADADFHQMAAICSGMRDEATSLLSGAGVRDGIDCAVSADMRYRGQGYEVNVTLPTAGFESLSKQQVADAFDRVYERIYHRVYAGIELEILNLRLVATARRPDLRLSLDTHASGAATAKPLKGYRQVYFPGEGYCRCAIYDRYALGPGTRFPGPAVIEERESTIVVGPDADAGVGEHGIVTLEMRGT